MLRKRVSSATMPRVVWGLVLVTLLFDGGKPALLADEGEMDFFLDFFQNLQKTIVKAANASLSKLVLG